MFLVCYGVDASWFLTCLVGRLAGIWRLLAGYACVIWRSHQKAFVITRWGQQRRKAEIWISDHLYVQVQWYAMHSLLPTLELTAGICVDESTTSSDERRFFKALSAEAEVPIWQLRFDLPCNISFRLPSGVRFSLELARSPSAVALACTSFKEFHTELGWVL